MIALSPVGSLVALALAQALIWFCLSQEWSPLVRGMNWFIARIPGGSRNVFLNTKQQYEFSGFPPPDSEENALAMHSFNYVALIHHAIGAALLLASFASNDAQLFRLGLSFEIGEDVLHTAQMVHAHYFPPGTLPVREFAKSIWPLLVLHHSLGLLGGSVAYLYLASNPEVQMLCALLLGAAVPGFANLPLFPLGDIYGTGGAAKANLVLASGGLVFMLYTRVIYFFPVCRRLVPMVFTEHGAAAGWAVLVSLVLFSLFNVVALGGGLYGVVQGGTPPARVHWAAHPERHARNVTGSLPRFGMRGAARPCSAPPCGGVHRTSPFHPGIKTLRHGDGAELKPPSLTRKASLSLTAVSRSLSHGHVSRAGDPLVAFLLARDFSHKLEKRVRQRRLKVAKGD